MRLRTTAASLSDFDWFTHILSLLVCGRLCLSFFVRRISTHAGFVAGVADPVDQFRVLLDVHVRIGAAVRDCVQHTAETVDFSLLRACPPPSSKPCEPTDLSRFFGSRAFILAPAPHGSRAVIFISALVGFHLFGSVAPLVSFCLFIAFEFVGEHLAHIPFMVSHVVALVIDKDAVREPDNSQPFAGEFYANDVSSLKLCRGRRGAITCRQKQNKAGGGNGS